MSGGAPSAATEAAEAPEAGRSAPDAVTVRAWLLRRWRATPPRRRLWGVLALAALIALALGWRKINWDAFHEHAEAWPAAWVVAIVGVSPLAGFPVSALHLAAGLRFEFWPAMLVVGATTLFQHVAAWALVRALPERCFARLEPWREKLAGAGHREAAVLCCLLPGMPYTVQLYLLPAMAVSLRVICLIGAPLHTARATVTILLGNLSDELTTTRVLALTAYYLAMFAACAFALRRMRRSLAARRGGESPGAEAGGAPMDGRGRNKQAGGLRP